MIIFTVVNITIDNASFKSYYKYQCCSQDLFLGEVRLKLSNLSLKENRQLFVNFKYVHTVQFIMLYYNPNEKLNHSY